MKDQMKYYGKKGIYIFFSTDIYFSVKVKGQLVTREEQIQTLSAAGNVSPALWRGHLQAGQHWRSPARPEKTEGIIPLYRHPKECTAPPETLGWGLTPQPSPAQTSFSFQGSNPQEEWALPRAARHFLLTVKRRRKNKSSMQCISTGLWCILSI